MGQDPRVDSPESNIRLSIRKYMAQHKCILCPVSPSKVKGHHCFTSVIIQSHMTYSTCHWSQCARVPPDTAEVLLDEAVLVVLVLRVVLVVTTTVEVLAIEVDVLVEVADVVLLAN